MQNSNAATDAELHPLRVGPSMDLAGGQAVTAGRALAERHDARRLSVSRSDVAKPVTL